MHFNKHVTFTAQKGPANIKRWLETTLGDLLEVVSVIRKKIGDQLRKIYFDIRLVRTAIAELIAGVHLLAEKCINKELIFCIWINILKQLRTVFFSILAQLSC